MPLLYCYCQQHCLLCIQPGWPLPPPHLCCPGATFLIAHRKAQAAGIHSSEKETEMDGATIAPEMKHQACKQHAAQCRRMHSRLENALSRYRTPGEHTSTGWKSAEHAELLLLTTQQCHTISCSALQKAYVELVDACRDTSSLLLPVQATPVKLLCLVAGLGALTAAVF